MITVLTCKHCDEFACVVCGVKLFWHLSLLMTGWIQVFKLSHWGSEYIGDDARFNTVGWLHSMHDSGHSIWIDVFEVSVVVYVDVVTRRLSCVGFIMVSLHAWVWWPHKLVRGHCAWCVSAVCRWRPELDQLDPVGRLWVRMMWFYRT